MSNGWILVTIGALFLLPAVITAFMIVTAPSDQAAVKRRRDRAAETDSYWRAPKPRPASTGFEKVRATPEDGAFRPDLCWHCQGSPPEAERHVRLVRDESHFWFVIGSQHSEETATARLRYCRACHHRFHQERTAAWVWLPGVLLSPVLGIGFLLVLLAGAFEAAVVVGGLFALALGAGSTRVGTTARGLTIGSNTGNSRPIGECPRSTACSAPDGVRSTTDPRGRATQRRLEATEGQGFGVGPGPAGPPTVPVTRNLA